MRRGEARREEEKIKERNRVIGLGGSSIWPGLVSVITLQAWLLSVPTVGLKDINTLTNK